MGAKSEGEVIVGRSCGKLRPRWHNSLSCHECCKIEERQRQKARRDDQARYGGRIRGGFVEVVEDPTGDFPSGALFNSVEFNSTLQAGFWPSGLVIKTPSNGKFWRVIGRAIRGSAAQ